MKKISEFIAVLFVCILFTGTLHAQQLPTAEHLKRLKEGVLLVKLYSRSPTIEAIRATGNEERAEEFAKEQHFKNMAIANAFEMNYNFTPKVYFFYSDDSRKVADGNFEGVLMGYDLQKLNKSDINDTAFYVAEFGHTKEKDIRALVIRDNKMNYLEAPFPYFVRTFEGLLFFERTYPKVVKLWNEKLVEEYSKYFVVPEGSK